MKRLTLKLLWPVSALILVFIGVMEGVWLPHLERQTVEQRIVEVEQLLEVVAGAIEQSPDKAGELISCLHEHQDTVSWRSITLDTAPLPVTQTANVLLSQSVSAGADWVLNATIHRDEIRRQLAGDVRILELGVVLAMLLTFGVMALLQRWLLIKPIGQLIRASLHLADGNPDYKLPEIRSTSSLYPLFSSFQTMRSALAEQHRRLSDEVEERQLAEERLIESHLIAKLGYWEWLQDRGQFWCSKSLQSILLTQVSMPETVEAFLHSVHPADRNEINKRLRQILNDLTETELDFRLSTPQGSYRHIHLISHVVADSSGSAKRIAGICQDITEQKSIESSLTKLSSAITHSGSSVLITDVLGSIEYANPKYIETTGFDAQALIGQQPELLSRKWIPADKYEALWQSILSGHHWRGELQSRRKDGSMFWSLVSISPIHNEYGELTHFVIVCEDVTELKDAHARMEQLALYDELTGLPNRRFFFRELSRLLEQDVVERPAVVMLLDLDYFKTVNDTQGHSAGDQLLIEVAKRLIDALHDDDIAARLGGDEFAILLHQVDGVDQVEVVAKRILQAISEPFLINSHEIQISTSLGMAWLPKDGQTPEALLKHADLAMYQAKALGRNQFRFFTESLHAQLQTYISFSREMPKALDTGEFMLVFQPQVDLITGNICSAEALVRWQHPEKGLVSPADFIPIAEETGFIVPLGRWIFAESCRALVQLTRAECPDLRLAINLSSRQFKDPHLLTMIRDTLKLYHIDPARIELEITESLLMQDIDLAIKTLSELQVLGVTVAIDDFGIGYSSFNYLKTLPINVLKVDREFIKDIPEHLDDMEITAAIISMAHRLNMKVVAEGIETPVQRVFLEEHHCDIGQGYLFSKPVPLPELITQLKGDQG